MNKFLILLFLFCASTFSVSEEIRILEVIDGDTVLAEFKGEKVRIRLSEIDAPELNQPFGKSAKFCLAELIDNNEYLEFNFANFDRYGRSLGWIMKNEKNLNYEMIKEGCAWVYDRYVVNKSIYSFQKSARLKKLGLWKQDDPIKPWVWRRNN